MGILEYGLLAFGSLFAIIDPIAAVPAFLAMTTQNTAQQKIAMAKMACIICAGTLAAFALFGRWIFKIFGITMPAFQIAGGVVLLMVSLDMLRAKRSQVQETIEETQAGKEKEDIAITPLAIPMLAGPGAISTVTVLGAQAANGIQTALLYISIILASFFSYWVFVLATRGAKWLNPIIMKVTTRLMGLLLAAIAVQFILTALKEIQ